MKITINDKSVELDGSARPTLYMLLVSQGILSGGIAVAVNNRVVRRSAWDDTVINDGDVITVITAICGG